MREVGLRGRARDVELRDLGADAPRARGAPRGCGAPARRTAPRSVLRRARRRRGPAPAARRTCAGRRRAAPPTRRSRRAARARRVCVALQLLAPARTTRVLELARGLLEPLRPRSPGALAALDQRGVRGLGFGGARRPAPASPRAPRTACAAPAFSCSSAARCSASMRCDRLARFVLARFLRAQLLFGRAALDGDLLLLARDALGRVAAPPHLQLEADDRLLLAVQLALQRQRSRTRRRRSTTSRSAISSRSRRRARARASARSRSSLISRLVVRMPRASARAPPSTTLRRRGTRRRRASRSAPRRRRGVTAGFEVGRDPGVHDSATLIASAAGPDTRTSRCERRQARPAIGAVAGLVARRAVGDEETDASGVAFAREPQAGRGVARACGTTTCWSRSPRQRLDGALVAAARPRGSRRPNPGAATSSRGFGEDQPRAVAVLGARGVELLERLQACRSAPASSCSRVRSRASERVALGARAGQLRLARRAIDAQRRPSPRARGAAPPRRRRAPVAARSRLDPQVAALDVELARAARRSACARPRGVLHRVAQRRRGVDRREHLAARRLDVRFEPFDLPLRVRVGVLFGRASVVRGLVALRRRRAPRPRGAPRARAAPARAAPRALRISVLDVAAPPRRDVSTCCLSNAICCCSRPISSSRACAASRARGGRASPPRSARAAAARASLSTSARWAAAAASRSRASASRVRRGLDRLRRAAR